MDRGKQPEALQRLARGEERAWTEFLEEYAPLIYQVARLFETDKDRLGDCVLFVCEHLHRSQFRRLRAYRPSGPASFTTWLRAVVRNLCLDWRRSRFDRRSWMRIAAELPPLECEAFRLLVLQGMTLSETLGSLALLYPSLSKDELEGVVDRLDAVLRGRPADRFRMSRPSVVSMTKSAEGLNGPSERPIEDPRPDPEVVALMSETRDRLTQALNRLAPKDRLLIRLRFEEELTLAEVARLTGLDSPQAADRRIRRALQELQRYMN